MDPMPSGEIADPVEGLRWARFYRDRGRPYSESARWTPCPAAPCHSDSRSTAKTQRREGTGCSVALRPGVTAVHTIRAMHRMSSGGIADRWTCRGVRAGARNRQASNPCDGAHAQRRDGPSDMEPSDRKTCKTTIRKRSSCSREQMHCRRLAATELFRTYPRCQRSHREVYEQYVNMSSRPRWRRGCSSAAAAVEGHDLEGRGLDAFEAADIDGGHGLARRVRAEAERRAAAGRTEVMFDDMLVEQVGGERAFRRREPQALARHEPQEIALAAAMGAVALHDLREIALDLERDAAAMAAAFVGHSNLPCIAVTIAPGRRGSTGAKLEVLEQAGDDLGG